MADDQDKGQKTEEPTEKKLSDAIQKGNVPQSREVGTLTSIVALALIALAVAPSAIGSISGAMLPLIENAVDIPVGAAPRDVLHAFQAFLLDIAAALLPIGVLLVLATLLGAFVQGNVVIAYERIRPKLDNLSPMRGFNRLFGLSAIVEFMKSLAKIAIVAGAVAAVIWPEMGRSQTTLQMEVSALPGALRELTVRLLLAVIGAIVLVTILDLLWRRFDWRRNLRMSAKEIKDEIKQVEGDPHIKAKIKSIRRQRARKRMMEAVPTATVVLMNPTHYAVALKYERGRDPVPVCVAKGLDLVALRIRELAEEHGVAVIEDPPLARALHKAVEIDEPIRPEHYRAVAEVITFVMAARGRVRSGHRPGDRGPPASGTR